MKFLCLSAFILGTASAALCGPDSPDIIYNEVPPGYAPADPKAPSCPYAVLDFNDMKVGDYVHEQYLQSHGVKITAIKNPNASRGYTPVNGVHNDAGGGAMVFDTAAPMGKSGQKLCGWNDGDSDLGSPNQFCPVPGPGVGVGGAPYINNQKSNGYNPHSNCESAGKVLIIQESNKKCPDDSADGGWINFEFQVPIDLKLVKILDVDEGDTPEITVTMQNGQQETFKTLASGDNGMVTTHINLTGVTSFRNKYYGSGSVAEVVYQVCPEVFTLANPL